MDDKDPVETLFRRTRAATESDVQSLEMTQGKLVAQVSDLREWRSLHMGEHKGYGATSRDHAEQFMRIDQRLEKISEKQIKHGKAIAVLIATAMGGGVSGALLTKLIGG